MKKFSLKTISIVALTLSLCLSPLLAQAARGARHQTLGVGVNLGEPIGFDGRLYFLEHLSLDLITGYGFDEKAFIIQPSILFNMNDVLDYNGRNFSFVPYFGAGFKTGIAEGGNGVAALRFPLGLNWVLQRGLYEVSLEFAPGVQFSPGNTAFDATGGVGLRYFLF